MYTLAIELNEFIKIHNRLTFASQSDFRDRTSRRAKNTMIKYFTETLGLAKDRMCDFNIVETVQISETEGLAIVRAIYRHHAFGRVHYFVLNYDHAGRATVIASYKSFKDAKKELTTTEETTEETTKETTKAKPSIKRLKSTTVKAYTNNQLTRHLDRLQDKFERCSPFRISISGQVFEYSAIDNAYYFTFTTNDRHSIIDAIESTYRQLGI